MSALPLLALLACGAEPPAPPPDARPLTPPGPTGDPRVAMTQAMDLRLTHPDVTDLWPDRFYRVDLKDETGEGRASLGLLDLDRDGRWDMRWTRDGETLMFEGSPDDDGEYSAAEPWNGGHMPGALPIPERSSTDPEQAG